MSHSACRRRPSLIKVKTTGGYMSSPLISFRSEHSGRAGETAGHPPDPHVSCSKEVLTGRVDGGGSGGKGRWVGSVKLLSMRENEKSEPDRRRPRQRVREWRRAASKPDLAALQLHSAHTLQFKCPSISALPLHSESSCTLGCTVRPHARSHARTRLSEFLIFSSYIQIPAEP